MSSLVPISPSKYKDVLFLLSLHGFKAIVAQETTPQPGSPKLYGILLSNRSDVLPRPRFSRAEDLMPSVDAVDSVHASPSRILLCSHT